MTTMNRKNGLLSKSHRNKSRDIKPSRNRRANFDRLGVELLETRNMMAVDYTAGLNYAQNFDTLSSSGTTTWTNDSTVQGWSLFNKTAGGTAITAITAGNGSSNAGSFFSFGTNAADRALGGLGSGGTYFGSPATGAVAGWMTASFVNHTGSTLTSFTTHYTGEEWRDGGNASAQTMVAQYGFGSSFTAVSTWTNAGSSFDFTSPIHSGGTTALDGNAAANRTTGLGGVVAGLNWAQNDTLWIRWVETNDAGNDHGLAIDDFTFAATGAPVNSPPTINVNTGINNVLVGTNGIVVDSTKLSTSDLEQTSPNQLTYTVTTLPTSGALKFNGAAVVANTTHFTQEDINNGLLTYDTSAEGNTSFNFTVSDGIAGGNTNGIFAISVLDVIHYNVDGSTYSQNFDTLVSAGGATTVPSGWRFLETSTSANGAYSANDGSLNSGDTYSYGTTSSTERAFGGLRSGALAPTVGAVIQNGTGNTLTSLTISYTGEQWRLGAAARPDQLHFQYSLDATSLDTGTWTDVNALDFASPNINAAVGALDGNAVENRTAISGVVTSLNIANGTNIWIRWNDVDVAGADDGLAVDDFTFSAQNAALNGPPQIDLNAGINNLLVGTLGFVINNSKLSASDPQQSASQLTYTVTALPSVGILKYNGAAVIANTTQFTQQDIDNGLLTYDATADGSSGFDFTISDGVGGNTSGTFNIKVLGVVNYAIDGSTYTQDFNSLASTGGSSTLPLGWALLETGTSANTSYTASTGSLNTGDTYSYGAASDTDRALGSLRSNAVAPTVGAVLKNNTGSTLTSFTIAYTGEQWRLGFANNIDQLHFQYSLDAVSLDTGSWIDVSALDFTTPNSTTAGAVDGNAVGNRTSLSDSISSLNIVDGGIIWVRWTDVDIAGSDDGLAVDDFSFSATSSTSNTAPSITTNTGVNVIAGSPGAVIGQSKLQATDAQQSASQLIYTVTSLPTTGTLKYNGSAVVANTTNFSQQDINNGLLTFDASAATAGSTDFDFSVTDGTLSTTGTFAINVELSNGKLRVVDYNITSSGGSPRAGLETILHAIGQETTAGLTQQIDVIALQEVASQSTTTQDVVALLDGIYGVGAYGRGSLDGATTGGGTQGIVYNTQKLELVEEVAIGTASLAGAPRQTLRYKFHPIGAESSADFYIYNTHLKAGTANDDESRRLNEVQGIRSDANALGQGTNIFYVGDFNIQSSSELSYQQYLSAGNGQAFDPISTPGNWHNNAAFVGIDTQTPAVSPGGGLTGGGLDDRFDFQLITGELLDNTGLDYIPTSYHTFGNNGSVALNGNINDPSSTALIGLANRTTVLDLLTTVSDHLPVVADYTFPTITVGAFTVVNTNDSGTGSLRQAILDVNASGGLSADIDFNIPGIGTQTIIVSSTLPALNKTTTFDISTGSNVVIGNAASGGWAGYTQLLVTGGGTLTINSAITSPGNTILDAGVLNVTQGLSGTGNLTISNGADFTSGKGLRQHALTISGDGSSAIVANNGGNAGLIKLDQLTMNGAAVLDVGDNDVILNYPTGNVGTTLTDVKTYFNNWYLALNPNGPQIQSQGLIDQFNNDPNHPTTLVVIDNGQLQFPEWGGEALPSTDQVLIKYTYVGDCNMDGQVDSVDYQILVGSISDTINQPYSTDFSWFFGDMDGDGLVNSVDYQQFVINLGQGIGNPLGAGGLGGSPALSNANVLTEKSEWNSSQYWGSELNNPLQQTVSLKRKQQAVSAVFGNEDGWDS